MAEMNGTEIAVKILLSKDEDKYNTETDMYAKLGAHDNILGYINSDIVGMNSSTEMWILTQYHANGTLL